MSAVKVFNSATQQKCSTSTSTKLTNVVQRMDARRQVLEQARRDKMVRIYKDIESIVKREQEYAKQVFEQLVPVKITWNEEALSQLHNMMPFRIETLEKDKNPVVVTPEVEEDDASSEDEKLEDVV